VGPQYSERGSTPLVKAVHLKGFILFLLLYVSLRT